MKKNEWDKIIKTSVFGLSVWSVPLDFSFHTTSDLLFE